MIKLIYISLVLLFLTIGSFGIVIPGLPTTPFLLLSAALFFRSSDKLYNKLISSKVFGKYITIFIKNKGMSIRLKIISLSIMWIMITLSLFLIDLFIVRVILIVAGVTGTIVMGFCIKTVHKKQKE